MTRPFRDPWELVQSGAYEEAIAAYTQLLREDSHPFNLFNRGLVYLMTGDHVAALDDFRSVLSNQAACSAASSHHIFLGVCYWFLDRPREAVESWRASVRARFTDAAGGVVPPALLVYAGERLHEPELGQEGLALLGRHWRNHLRYLARRKTNSRISHEDLVHEGLVAWPGAIVPFLLGHMDRAGFLRAAAASPALQPRWQCQADFYLGLQALRQRERPQYQEAMRRAAASASGKLEQEWYLARWEVERGFPEPAFG